MALEILLTKLRHAASCGLITHRLQIIAMSATMGGLECMCNWLDAVRRFPGWLCFWVRHERYWVW